MGQKGKKTNKAKTNPLQSVMTSWKKIDSEKRVFIIIIVILFAFVFLMPNVYRGWVSFRDNGFRFSNNKKTTTNTGTQKDPNKGKTLTMTCTQSVKDSRYETNIKSEIYYVDSELKRENYTVTLKAVSDEAKAELATRKSLYDGTVEFYQGYDGFDAKVEVKDNLLTYKLATDYAKIDRDKINSEYENSDSGQSVALRYNQDIDSVKSYYENLGLICRK